MAAAWVELSRTRLPAHSYYTDVHLDDDTSATIVWRFLYFITRPAIPLSPGDDSCTCWKVGSRCCQRRNKWRRRMKKWAGQKVIFRHTNFRQLQISNRVLKILILPKFIQSEGFSAPISVFLTKIVSQKIFRQIFDNLKLFFGGGISPLPSLRPRHATLY